jgi:uncharacterized membrane protein YccC
MHDRVLEDAERLTDAGKTLNEHADDIALIRETIERLSMSGSTEGAREIAKSIESAETDVAERFDEESDALEATQAEAAEHESDLLERGESVERDLGELSDASARFHTDAPSDRFIEAKDAALEDIEILRQQAEEIGKEREQSEALQASLDALVRQRR